MSDFIKSHKKPFIITATVLAAALFVVYLAALFTPGIWHNDVFLRKQSDSVFSGSDTYADYTMKISKQNGEADILFTANDIERQYRVTYGENNTDVKIYENEELAFSGSAAPVGEFFILIDENGEALDMLDVTTVVNSSSLSVTERLPSYTALFNLAVAESYDIRGNVAMLVIVLICAAVLVLDIAFPDFFFTVGHRLAVYGGEPSDFYRFMQKVSRAVLAVAILVCVVLTFTIR